MEDQLEKQIGDGQRVRDFLADPAVKAAFEAVARQLFAEFAQPNADVLRIHARVQAVNDVRGMLEGIVGNGAVAERRLEVETQRAEQQRRQQPRRQ